MTIPPELKAALKEPDLSTEELVEVLRRNSPSLPSGIYYDPDMPFRVPYRGTGDKNIDRSHRNDSFWDSWTPLIDNQLVGELEWAEMNHEDLSAHDPAIKGYSTIREKLVTWLSDGHRSENTFLIFQSLKDHYRIGCKEAVYRAFMKICYESGRLGADAWLSIHESWAQRICGQLADQYPPYRRVLARRLLENPGILRRCSQRALLQHLVLDPWHELRASYPLYADKPPVIFLSDYAGDLDRYNTIADVLELVSEGRSKHKPCLLWVATIRTPHPRHTLSARKLEVILPSLISLNHCTPLGLQHVTIPVGTEEASKYSYLTLRTEFQAIRTQHSTIFHTEEVWPLEEDLWQIARIASGVDVFVHTLVRFVDRGGDASPRERLQKCLIYIADSPTPTLHHELLPLIHLYRQIFFDVPCELRPCAFRLLECLFNHHLLWEPTVTELEHFLEIRQETINRTAAHLRWIVNSSTGYRYRTSYNISGTSDAIFNLSNRLHQPIVARTYTQAAESYLNLLRKAPFASLVPKCYPQSRINPLDVIERKRRFDLNLLCDIYRAPRKEWGALRYLLGKFDFSRMVSLQGRLRFGLFLAWINWLRQAGGEEHVRTRATGPVDEMLLEKCKKLATPLDFKIGRSMSSYDRGIGLYEKDYFEFPKYVLLGQGTQAVVAILHEVTPIGPNRSLGRNIEGAIYSLDMLHEL